MATELILLFVVLGSVVFIIILVGTGALISAHEERW